jgi:hypothetical protein
MSLSCSLSWIRDGKKSGSGMEMQMVQKYKKYKKIQTRMNEAYSAPA